MLVQIQFCLVKEGILRVHPDLAGKLAENGQLTTESASEQSQANLDQLSPQEKAILGVLNCQYKEKFGFPFVICARLNKKESIIHGLKTLITSFCGYRTSDWHRISHENL